MSELLEGMTSTGGMKYPELGQIAVIVIDVDGCLCPPTITLDSNGEELKVFSARDAPAASMMRSLGLRLCIITGRPGKAVERRALELKATSLIYRKDIENNPERLLARLRQEPENNGLEFEHIFYVGDDIGDIPFLAKCKHNAIPADAAEEVLPHARWHTKAKGGEGVLREVVKAISLSQSPT